MENTRYTEVQDSGQFSQGREALMKLAKILFRLMSVLITVMVVWFFIMGGFFIVDSTKESVLLLHFGKMEKEYTKGWDWVFPYPVNRIVRVPKTNQTIRSSTFMPQNKQALIDRKAAKDPANAPKPLAAGKDGFLLTGDNSILHTEWELVYSVTNATVYYETCLTPARPLDPDDIVTGEDGEAAGTRGATTMIRKILDECVVKVTASWKIENILYDRTNDYISEVQALLVKSLNERGIGVTVQSLTLPVKRPPQMTIEAFDEAASAGSQAAGEKETARAYAIEMSNSAKAEAAEIIAKAHSYRKRVIAEVLADKIYFTRILEEYKKNPESVMVSLYSTTLADSMSTVREKFIIGVIPGKKQELRLKLNPEPVIKKTEKEEKKK